LRQKPTAHARRGAIESCAPQFWSTNTDDVDTAHIAITASMRDAT
jgi:hypothetical protein